MKEQKVLKTLAGISLIIFVTVIFPLTAFSESSNKVYKIGLSQIISHPGLDMIRDRFIETMAKEGYVEGKNVKYVHGNPEGDMSVAKAIADKFVAEKCDVIAPMTTPITQTICVSAKGSGIPIVFTAVTDPVGTGIVTSWEKPCSPGIKVTGVSDYVSVRPRLEMIKDICPNAKVLGAVYNAGDESTTKTMEQLLEVAPEFGLKVVEANVSTTADVYSAAMSLVGRADVAWFPMCNTTTAGLEGLVSVCEKEKIPLFVPDPESVKRGGIGCIQYSMDEMADMQAEAVIRVLKGEDVCNIKVRTFENTKATINPSAAKRMGVTISRAYLDSAGVIIDK